MSPTLEGLLCALTDIIRAVCVIGLVAFAVALVVETIEMNRGR